MDRSVNFDVVNLGDGRYLHMSTSINDINNPLEKNDVLYIKEYYKGLYKHREDGPAVEWITVGGVTIVEEWWVNDKMHKNNGPAEIVRYDNGEVDYENWYFNGEMVTDLIQRLGYTAPISQEEYVYILHCMGN